jgi:hypothetical protein
MTFGPTPMALFGGAEETARGYGHGQHTDLIQARQHTEDS